MDEQVRVSAKKPEAKRTSSFTPTPKTDVSHSTNSPIDQILHLQRTIGNQAVQRLLKSGMIQAKLRIGQPNDKYEQEADRVADEVMRMPEPGLQRQVEPEEEEGEETLQPKSLVSQITPLVQVQRQEEPEEEEEELQTKPLTEQITPLVQRQVEPEEEEEEEAIQTKLVDGMQVQRQEEPEEEEEPIQTKQVSTHTPAVTPSLASRIQSLKGGGQPLPKSARAFFEPRFSHDFSQVRIHTDDRAAKTARTINAQAFTVGRNIVFGAGEYTPETAIGKRLLAHELTHVVQQGSKRNVQPELQKSPDVGFIVHSLTRKRGYLDDPSEDGAGRVSWPLSFAVTSPLDAQADVEVTGGSADPCTSYEIGFVQTVHTHWLHFYYWGRSKGHGSIIVKQAVKLPIRDGEPGTFWYASTSYKTPSICNVHVKPNMDDYPTIFLLPKVRTNSKTGQPNYLKGVVRGIHFVTTLVASGPIKVKPLRFFYWNYLMSIRFRPNYGAPTATWSFKWQKNVANLGKVHKGGSKTVPIFTTATKRFNQSLTQKLIERT